MLQIGGPATANDLRYPATVA